MSKRDKMIKEIIGEYDITEIIFADKDWSLFLYELKYSELEDIRYRKGEYKDCNLFIVEDIEDNNDKKLLITKQNLGIREMLKFNEGKGFIRTIVRDCIYFRDAGITLIKENDKYITDRCYISVEEALEDGISY